jgi:hypothetical protein
MCAASQAVTRPDTSPPFQLLAWLDDGTDSQGERYLEIRQRLVSYFDRRNRPAPDLLVDETFDRIARTPEEDGQIRVTPPARYCFVVARYVLLEDLRRAKCYLPLDERRRDLAAAFDVTMNALATRAWRLHSSLQTCVTGCQQSCR